jgi:hypothetical protein
MTRSRRRSRSRSDSTANTGAQTSGASQLVAIVLIVLVAYLGFQQFNRGDSPKPLPDDSVIVDPDKLPDDKSVNPVDVKGTYLIVVIERKSIPVKQQMVLNHRFWQSLAARGVKFSVLDPEIEDGQAYAKLSKIPPPFVAHEMGDGKIRKVIPFPDSIDQVEALLR